MNILWGERRSSGEVIRMVNWYKNEKVVLSASKWQNESKLTRLAILYPQYGLVCIYSNRSQAALKICLDSCRVFQLRNRPDVTIGPHNSDRALVWIHTIGFICVLKFCSIVESHLCFCFHNIRDIFPNKSVRRKSMKNY